MPFAKIDFRSMEKSMLTYPGRLDIIKYKSCIQNANGVQYGFR